MGAGCRATKRRQTVQKYGTVGWYDYFIVVCGKLAESCMLQWWYQISNRLGFRGPEERDKVGMCASQTRFVYDGSSIMVLWKCLHVNMLQIQIANKASAYFNMSCLLYRCCRRDKVSLVLYVLPCNIRLSNRRTGRCDVNGFGVAGCGYFFRGAII